jgi:hypothetical protein
LVEVDDCGDAVKIYHLGKCHRHRATADAPRSSWKGKRKSARLPGEVTVRRGVRGLPVDNFFKIQTAIPV